jgi:hypothetical protein
MNFYLRFLHLHRKHIIVQSGLKQGSFVIIYTCARGTDIYFGRDLNVTFIVSELSVVKHLLNSYRACLSLST